MLTEIEAKVVIDMPRSEAWEKLKNLELAHNYVPGIVDTQITTDLKEGVGTSRRVYRSSSRYMEETVTEWNEGSGFKIRLHKGEKDVPFKNAQFVYLFEDTSDGKTAFTATMLYTAPGGMMGRAVNALLLRRIITSSIRDVAISMKSFYETGQAVDSKMLKQLRKQNA